MAKDQNTLSLGDWNALCDVCGFKFKASDLRERWDGMMVCEDDFEQRHPSDFYNPPLEDDDDTPWIRPDTAETSEGAATDVGGNAFPNAENTTATGTGLDLDSDDDGIGDAGTFSTNNGTI